MTTISLSNRPRQNTFCLGQRPLPPVPIVYDLLGARDCALDPACRWILPYREAQLITEREAVVPEEKDDPNVVHSDIIAVCLGGWKNTISVVSKRKYTPDCEKARYDILASCPSWARSL